MSVIAVWRGMSFPGTGLWHFGVLCTDGQVIHYVRSNNSRSTSKCDLARTSYEEFQNPMGSKSPSPVYNVPVTGKHSVEEVTLRASRELTKKADVRNYNLLYNNCESFAVYCAKGEKLSNSLTGFMSLNSEFGQASEVVVGVERSSQVSGLTTVCTGSTFLALFIIPLIIGGLSLRLFAKRSARKVKEIQARKVIQAAHNTMRRFGKPGQFPPIQVYKSEDYNDVFLTDLGARRTSETMYGILGPWAQKLGIPRRNEDPRNFMFDVLSPPSPDRRWIFALGFGFFFIVAGSLTIMNFLPALRGWTIRSCPSVKY